jgi:hypothetical protein
MMMRTVSTRYNIVRPKRANGADRYRFLADGRMYAARDLASKGEGIESFLKAPDKDHCLEPLN